MRWLVLMGALVACSQSSNGSCPSTGSLEISLADSVSEVPICDATVTLTPKAGGTAQKLMVTNCQYFGAVTSGQYTLSAAKSGYQTLSQSLAITPDGCTVESPTLALELTPNM